MIPAAHTMQRESASPDTSMEYTGKLYGKIGRAYIPLKLTSADVDAKDTEIVRLKTALQQAYVHNQNMHCFVTKGRLNDQLNEQTHLLRKALGIPDQQAPQESTIDTPVCRSVPPPSPTPPEEDPYQSEDYQRFVAKTAETCEAEDGPCDACLAGGICDGPSDTGLEDSPTGEPIDSPFNPHPNSFP